MLRALLLLLFACKGSGDAVDDTGPGVIRDSERVDDSADTADSTDDTGGVELVSLEVWPSRMVVAVDAGYSLRARVTDSTGQSAEAEVSWASSDTAIATVDAEGVVTAVSAGTATLRCTLDALSADATVEVRDDGQLLVRVIDASTGDPLPDARVTWNGVRLDVDEAGEATFSVPGADPVDITADVPGGEWVPVTAFRVVPREVVLPLRPRDRVSTPDATLQGTADLSQCVEADWDERVIGLVGPSLQEGPLFFGTEQLLAPDRTITFFGLDVDIPGNVYIEDAEESWQALAWSGAVGAWSFAGPVPVDELSAGFEAPAQAIDVLLSHLDDFRYTWVGDLTADAAQPLTVDLTPSVPFDDSVPVVVPELPDGFSGSERALLLVLEPAGDAGPVLVGIAHAGPGEVEVARVAEDAFSWVPDGEDPPTVMAYVEVGGVGAGGGFATVLADVQGGVAELPAWMVPPVVDQVEAATKRFTLTSDPRAALVRAYVSSGDRSDRDLYLPAGAVDAVIPENTPPLGLGRTSWQILAVETLGLTYEAALIDGSLTPTSLRAAGASTAGNGQVVVGE